MSFSSFSQFSFILAFNRSSIFLISCSIALFGDTGFRVVAAILDDNDSELFSTVTRSDGSLNRGGRHFCDLFFASPVDLLLLFLNTVFALAFPLVTIDIPLLPSETNFLICGWCSGSTGTIVLGGLGIDVRQKSNCTPDNEGCTPETALCTPDNDGCTPDTADFL